MTQIVFKIGDHVKRIDRGGGAPNFPVGSTAIITAMGDEWEDWGDGPVKLVHFDNGGCLYNTRIELVNTEIEGDDDEDCI